MKLQHFDTCNNICNIVEIVVKSTLFQYLLSQHCFFSYYLSHCNNNITFINNIL